VYNRLEVFFEEIRLTNPETWTLWDSLTAKALNDVSLKAVMLWVEMSSPPTWCLAVEDHNGMTSPTFTINEIEEMSVLRIDVPLPDAMVGHRFTTVSELQPPWGFAAKLINAAIHTARTEGKFKLHIGHVEQNFPAELIDPMIRRFLEDFWQKFGIEYSILTRELTPAGAL
jgi:hypothetical protein